jgi:hypothetical protein
MKIRVCLMREKSQAPIPLRLSPERYLYADNLAVGPVHVVECLEGVLRVPPVLRVVHAQEVPQEQRLLRPGHFLKGLGHEIEYEYFDKNYSKRYTR